MIHEKHLLVVLAALLGMFYGCYSFTGIAVNPEAETFYVLPFSSQTTDAPPVLPDIFTQKLSDKVRNDTPLKLSETDPDIAIKGVVTTYRVSSEAPQAGELTALNRLNVSVKITIDDSTSSEGARTFTASWAVDFPGDVNLLDVQDQLIEEVTDQLVEDIFNKAFTSW